MLKSCRQILFSGLFGFLFLVFFKTGLLYHMQQYSLFCPKGEYLLSFFGQPGGILALTGAFLTQFCHYPVLGAALIALCLSLLTWLTGKSFGLEGKATWLAVLPALFLLLFITRMDYSVYLLKTYGILFSQILGFTVTTALVLIYKKCFARKRFNWAFPAAVILAGYPLLGSFAILAGLLTALLALREGKRGFVDLALAVIFGAAVPWFCAIMPGIFPQIHRDYVYFAGFPYREFVGNFICLVPLILAALSMAALVFLRKAGGFTVPTIVLAALAGILAGSNWDRGFHTVLGMERAVAQQDWDKVLDLAGKQKSPNRIHVLYRNIALYEKGSLTEKMFKYPDGDVPLRTMASIPIAYVCSAPVLYYSGMLNSCDRLSMEISSSFSKNVHYFKYQAKTALLCGENALARKYIDMVAENLFEGRWVRKYRDFLDAPETIDGDAEFRRLRPLLGYGPGYDMVAPLEEMLENHFSDPAYVNESVFEWQAACYMTRKDAEKTLYCVFDRHELLPEAPVGTCLAEAAALFASQMGDLGLMRELTRVLASRQAVLRRFSQFSNAVNASPELHSPKTKERFAAQYDGTYWYYYYFTDINTK